MKKVVANIMATTGITLVVLAFIGFLYGARFLFISSVFQSFGANIVIHLGYFITRRFESKYAIVEALLDITYTIVVLIISGAIFNWYTSVSIWILVIMAVLVYFFGCIIDSIHMREDIKRINKLLQKRNS